MSEWLPFLVVGVTAGSLYGLAGMGLVLTFKTSGVFNFAHGALAAAGAYAFYELHVNRGVAWPLALVVSVAGLALAGGFGIERLTRRLATAPPVLAIAATVGLLLAIQGALYWRFGFDTLRFPDFVSGRAFTVGTVTVSRQSVVGVLVGAVGAAGLFLMLRLTRLGASMRAVVDAPDLLDLTGTSPVRVRTMAWVIGSAFAALTGILIAPSLGLDATLLTLLVVQAFGAAALGRFTSLPLTFFGGVLVGVAAALLTKAVSSTPTLVGLPSSVPFFILVVVLVVAAPRGAAARPVRRAGSGPAPLPPGLRRGGAAVAAVAVVAVPHVVGAKLPVYINGGIFVIVFVSLSLLVWTSGQMSLCHAALAALGASTFAHLTTGLGLPWFVAFVGAGLAAIPLGALVAVPAIRLSGVYLALATFGFGILTQRVLYGTGFMFGAVDLRSAPRPGFARGDVAFYYLVVALAAAVCLLVTVVLRTRLGRLLRALGDSPRAMSTIGLSVNVTRLLVFCLSAFLAGTAGALFMAATGQGGGRGFPAINSLLWLTVLVVCGSKVVWSSAAAAVLLAVAPSYLPSGLVQHQAMIFGVVATVAAVVAAGGTRFAPTGIDRHERNPVQARLGDAALDGLAPTPALRRIRIALAAGSP